MKSDRSFFDGTWMQVAGNKILGSQTERDKVRPALDKTVQGVPGEEHKKKIGKQYLWWENQSPKWTRA